MSNAVIKQQGDHALVADNLWEFDLAAPMFALGALVGAGALIAARRFARPADAFPSGRMPATPRHWPIAFIHRGGAAVVPEDTAEGFREGIRYGDGVIELDVHATVDGEIVVMHDETVDRTTDGTGRIAELSSAEIARLDAGHRFTSDAGLTYPWRGRGVTVPTLAGVYRDFPDHKVNIEIKSDRPDIADKVWAVIDTAGASDRTLVVTKHHAVIERFRTVSNATVATAASVPELLGFWLLSRAGAAHRFRWPFQALQPPETFRGLRIVSRDFLRSAHRLGLRVDVWTIDDEADMRRLLSWGADGIMTDRPDVLAQVLGRPAATRSVGTPG